MAFVSHIDSKSLLTDELFRFGREGVKSLLRDGWGEEVEGGPPHFAV